jgi:hypothetical protein
MKEMEIRKGEKKQIQKNMKKVPGNPFSPAPV